MNKVVHLVDDDDAVRDSLTFLLETHGFEVSAYKSATDFLAARVIGAGGCVLLDLHLPVISGLDLLIIMRQRKMRIPVVFITGRSDKEIKERATRVGAVAFLDKPICEESLMAAIYGALNLCAADISTGPKRQVPLPA